ncbi:hypothetical protein FOZ61_008383, partial [Perkinsus olseni]
VHEAAFLESVHNLFHWPLCPLRYVPLHGEGRVSDSIRDRQRLRSFYGGDDPDGGGATYTVAYIGGLLGAENSEVDLAHCSSCWTTAWFLQRPLSSGRSPHTPSLRQLHPYILRSNLLPRRLCYLPLLHSGSRQSRPPPSRCPPDYNLSRVGLNPFTAQLPACLRFPSWSPSRLALLCLYCSRIHQRRFVFGIPTLFRPSYKGSDTKWNRLCPTVLQRLTRQIVDDT